uniref:Uncharacterized protein n=1 Tax=Oryzias latipes TaxID=8090 RepID=A0A3B3IBZ7_ORYLA
MVALQVPAWKGTGDSGEVVRLAFRSETRRDGGFKHSWSFSPPNETSFSSEWVFTTFVSLTD